MLLQHLVTFLRIVEEGSFTRAAERLNLSQPAVTKQLKALERAMGSQLIRRSRRGRAFELTEAGELVEQHARRIVQSVDECKKSVATLLKPGRGHFTISAVLTIILYTLPQLLTKYAKEHPNVNVHVRTGINQETLNDVLRGESEIGLVTVPLTHEQLTTYPLFRDRVVLVGSPDAEWTKRGSISGAEVSRLPFISYHRGSRFRDFVDASFEAAGIATETVMDFDSHEAVKMMVRLGYGAAMLPETAVHEEIAHGELRPVAVEGLPEISRVTSAILRRDRPPTPPVATFLELLRTTYPAEPAPGEL